MQTAPRLGAAGLVAALLIGTAGCQSGSAVADGDGPVDVGTIYDLSGSLSAIGTPKSDAAKLAIEDINASGGVLGRQLNLIGYDAQSDNAKYTQYATALVQKDQVAAIDAGVTSASREAIRPIVDAAGIPYFYGNLYEGGLCDGNVFATGSVPSQQLAQLVPYAKKNFGSSFTILAADYNFGHDEAAWAQKYIEENGGTVTRTEYLPLDQTDFGSTLNNLQQDKPSVVVSLLVGGDQMAFYKQFAAAGLGASTHIITPVFGDGQEQLSIGGAATEGIVIAYSYLQELDTPANTAFLAKWHAKYGDDYPYVTPSAVAVWNDWHLWAAAVTKAGTFDRDKVIGALESGVSYDGPGGKITIDGGSHHAIQNVYVAQGTKDGTFSVLQSYDQVSPAFEHSTCDLITKPDTNQQFKP
ncbi:ABC transporter substrate-binding protein [Actinoplanes sp. NPDC051851]|uniref:ABC transporter substrate-binding protein n=1 Tax=Actinoplanes sp. NPDC051851 TaxID=3154753 RepID=UPI0034270787